MNLLSKSPRESSLIPKCRTAGWPSLTVHLRAAGDSLLSLESIKKMLVNAWEHYSQHYTMPLNQKKEEEGWGRGRRSGANMYQACLLQNEKKWDVQQGLLCILEDITNILGLLSLRKFTKMSKSFNLMEFISYPLTCVFLSLILSLTWFCYQDSVTAVDRWWKPMRWRDNSDQWRPK